MKHESSCSHTFKIAVDSDGYVKYCTLCDLFMIFNHDGTVKKQ